MLDFIFAFIQVVGAIIALAALVSLTVLLALFVAVTIDELCEEPTRESEQNRIDDEEMMIYQLHHDIRAYELQQERNHQFFNIMEEYRNDISSTR